MTAENMKLWDSVFGTDPAHTKGFQKGGGFKGTAIKPYWLIKRATETFGPCGIGWGWEELENKLVSGVWCSKVRLWFKSPDGKSGRAVIAGDTLAGYGTIEQWGQTVMEGQNKNGTFVDEEAPKKAVTDAVTKCLSYLGFAGDVHMGLFDDSKYVAERAAEERQAKAKPTAKSVKERHAELKAMLLESDDPGAVWHDHLAEINEIKARDAQAYEDLRFAGAQRKGELAEREKNEAAYGQSFMNTPA
jgi:hypothetical protein